MTRPIEQDVAGPDRGMSSARGILILLFLGNLLNYYDRAIPSIVLGPIQKALGVDDFGVSILASAFVLVAAFAGIPLGRLADRIARTTVAGVGLLVWSVFSALSAIPAFAPFFIARMGVGIGESSYAPPTASLIPDMYPPERRNRANALFTLGFPIGTLIAFLTVGAFATAFGSWQAPFIIAAVPGVVIGLLVLRLREPRRGATESLPLVPDESPTGAPHRASAWALLRKQSIWGLVIAFAGYNFAAYAIGTFLPSVLGRTFGLGIITAGLLAGFVIGVMGLVGLLIGGPLRDRAGRRSPGTRNLVTAIALVAAAIFAALGLIAGPGALVQFMVFISLAYLLGIIYLAASVPATADVVAPAQRSTAFGIIFSVGLLLGGAGGPIAVGIVSVGIAKGATGVSAAAAAAQGLQGAMAILVPIAFVVAALGMVLTIRPAARDRASMIAQVERNR